MRRVRSFVGIGIGILAVVLIVWWLRGSHDDDGDSDDSGSGRSAKIDPRTGKPFAMPSAIGDRKIAGKVVINGAPVVGASVFVTSRTAPSHRTATTDAEGRFDFGMVAASAYTIIADKPKLAAATRSLDLRNPAIKSDAIVLTLYPCDTSIHGAVRDAGGPIAKAHLAVAAADDEALGGVESDDQGNYELCVPADGATVIVDADGYARESAYIATSGRLRRDFLLVPEAVVVGRVVRDKDRAPVPGAVVELTNTDFTRGRSVRRALADDEGKFRIDGVAPGRYWASARTDRLASVEPTDVIAEVGNPGEPVVCTVSAASTIAGRVVDHDHNGVAGLSVVASNRNAGPGPASWRDGISGIDGSFVIDQVLPGDYMVGVVRELKRKDGGQIKVTVADADVRDLVIETETLGSIAGHVFSEGKPAEGVPVRADNFSFATSEHDGSFVLRAVPAGAHQLYAESKRLGAFTQSSITLAVGEQRTGVDITLDLAGSIAGVVVDQNDQPVSGAFLSFTLLSGRDFGQATTDEAGRFRAGAMSGGGEYAYEVRIGQGGTVLPPLEGRRHPPIAVADGRTHITDVRVHVRYERLVIAGKVVSSKGEPVPDVTVRAMRAVKSSYDQVSATTDAAGVFTIRDVTTGTYTLMASSPHAAGNLEDVAAGRKDVVIRLADPGSIEGTLVGFTTAPAVNAFGGDTRTIYRGAITGSTFVIRDVPPGIYQVMARLGDDPPAVARVDVKSGETAKTTLTRSASGIVIATLIDELTRKPVANASCSASGSYGTTDASGVVRFDKARAGSGEVWCKGVAGFGSAEITVAANETTRVEVVVRGRQPGKDSGHAGFQLEDKLGESVIVKIEPGGPAARAGLQVGDTLLQIDGKDVEGWTSVRLIESRGAGTVVKLKIEHANVERVVELKLDPTTVDDKLMNGAKRTRHVPTRSA